LSQARFWLTHQVRRHPPAPEALQRVRLRPPPLSPRQQPL